MVLMCEIMDQRLTVMFHSVCAAVTKPVVPSATSSPCALKNNVKKEDGVKPEDVGPSSDQLVPDYAARPVINLYILSAKP